MRRSVAELARAVPVVDEAIARAAQLELDQKTKPKGSLGALESIAVRIAAARGGPLDAPLRHAVIVFAADHGVAARGVSAYPPEVTVQMIGNYAAGGAAINVLSRLAGARLVVVDVGSRATDAVPGVVDARRARGTRDWTLGPAMTDTEVEHAALAGAALVDGLAEEGVTSVALGEMGIGNTTTAALLAAGLLDRPPIDLVGRGTGVCGVALDRKRAVVARGIELHGACAGDALVYLARAGGFEIAALVGAILAAAARRRVVVLDGFIVSTAALVAVRLCPAAVGYLIASHVSAEAGHRLVLDALGLEPLLDLGLRLGEGSGAALALPLLDGAVAILCEMATFSSAGVSEATRA